MNYGFPLQSQQQAFQSASQQTFQPQQQVYQPITATFPTASADPHYKGYEQAVIEHAKMLQIQQAKEKIFGVPAKRKPFVGQWQKRPKGPPKEPVDPRKYFCEVCNVACAGEESFQQHKVGKSHRHKENLKTGKTRLDLKRPGFHCEICNATCSSKDAFHAHLNGAKHQRAIKTLQMLGKPIPEYLLEYQPKGDPMMNLPVVKKVVGVSATKFIGGIKLSNTQEEDESAISSNEPENTGYPPIGEEFLEVIPTEGRKCKSSYRCKLCECNIGDPTAKDAHIRGRRHRMAYKQKIDPTIDADERVIGRNGPYIRQAPAERATKANRSIASKLNPPMKASSYHSSFLHGPFLPDTTASDAYDEQLVNTRLEQIEPSPEFTEKVEDLVESIERALKNISDILIEKGDDGDVRLLRGVVRVGPLGDKTLLNFDKAVNVVLQCNNIPTVSLLQKIMEEMPKHSQDRFIFESLPDESAFRAQIKDFDVTCTVTLTSFLFRSSTNDAEEKTAETNGENASSSPEIVKPADSLPEQSCLRALSDFRHTKFFQAQCADIPNLAEIVKLLRDVVRRIDTWSVLSNYMVELLAYKALSSHPAPLQVADGLRRFFEMISAGVLMSAHSILSDPCEKGKVNALAGMTAQQRENLVCSAQHGLRLITYDQLYTILGISRDSINTRKRANPTEDDETNETKKMKLPENVNEDVLPPSQE